MDGSVPNHGILLDRAPTGDTVFCSSDFVTAGQRPRLDVCYVPGL